MFSRRLQWPYPPNRLSRLLEEKRACGAAVLDLTESNPTRVGLGYPAEAIAAALHDPAVAAYEPSPRGLEEARAAVAAWHAQRGLRADPARIVLTAGTSEAYSYLWKLLADPGDVVLVPRPSYPLFDYLAALDGLKVAGYPLHADDDRWAIDFAALEAACGTTGGQEPRAIVVVNPNNPTGSALREGERARLEGIAARAGAAIISDEVFLDFLDPPAAPAPQGGAGDRIVSLLAEAAAPRTVGSAAGRSGPLKFALGGLSKSCGLPQMKLGWIVVDGPDGPAGEALERLDLIADTYLSVGTPVQRAAARLLQIGGPIRAAIRERLADNLGALRKAVGPASSCRVQRRDGGWYAVVQVPAVVTEEDRILALLAEDDVLVHPGYFFDFPREAYLVLSLLPDPATFREAVRRILARVER
ncbi:MAG: pyridoxal phosphate-dependent aminotransferase [Acidobacteria bacterium]|nr:pyridoxal phosphate-dependent aminotransferase [Acidobacteriota bacterium]